MRISLGENSKKALKLFNLEYPFSSENLKSSYRPLLLKHHPDKNGGDAQSEKMTRLIISSYEHIEHLAKDNLATGKKVHKNKDDMFDLTEVCPKCKGEGVECFTYKGYLNPCPDCTPIYHLMGFNTPSGRKAVACNQCAGTGKFTLRSGRKVECRRCEGKGTVIVRCPTCRGRRTVPAPEEHVTHECDKCYGSGYIKIDPFNPVIPKGAIAI